MSLDDPRTRAFRRWVRHLDPQDGLAIAQQRTGIGLRTLQRLFSGGSTLSPRLAEEIAAGCDDVVIAAALRASVQEGQNA